MSVYEYHPIANLFPLLEEDAKEQKELAESIKIQGLVNAIVLFEGKILDGRNRYHVCLKLGIEPRSEQYTGDDPVGFVAAQNLHRRHLSFAQRAFIAEEMANMRHGGDRKSAKYQDVNRRLDPKIGIVKAAQNMQVPKTSVDRVRRIKRDALPEVIQAAKEGKIGIEPAANKIAKLPKEKQAAALAGKTAKQVRPQERVIEKPGKSEPAKPQTHSKPSHLLTAEAIAEREARINAPSIYPEDLPLPVHPNPALTAHIQEAFVDLKANELRIAKMSRKWLYEEIWVYTQRIQSYAPGYGKPADVVVDIHPRQVEWARSVAGKVRAREDIVLYTPQKLRNDPKEHKFSELGLEKLLKEWQRLLKRGLRELHFATDQESRVLQTTEQIILTYFEERRTRHVRLTPSPTGEPTQTINGSPSLNREH